MRWDRKPPSDDVRGKDKKIEIRNQIFDIFDKEKITLKESLELIGNLLFGIGLADNISKEEFLNYLISLNNQFIHIYNMENEEKYNGANGQAE